MSTKVGRDSNGNPIQAMRIILPTTRIAITASSQEVPRVALSTTVVRLVCDVACWVRIGKSVTPDNGAYLPAGLVEYFVLANDQQVHVVGASGSLYVSECS